MNSTDPIADMLTRIRNALMRRQPRVVIPYSQLKEEVARIFLKSGYIANLRVKGEIPNKVLEVELINDKLPISPITALERWSRPGRRRYVDWRTIPTVKNGRGLLVLSTNKGLMTGREAQTARLGGEIMCSIY